MHAYYHGSLWFDCGRSVFKCGNIFGKGRVVCVLFRTSSINCCEMIINTESDILYSFYSGPRNRTRIYSEQRFHGL